MYPNILQIFDDEMNEINVVSESYAKFFSFYVKENCVKPVKILQDQYILG